MSTSRALAGYQRLGLTVMALCALLMLSACVPSVHPLYTPDDVVFDPALIGIWKGTGKKETWIITPADDKKEYIVTFVGEKEKQASFKGHVVLLGEDRFINLYPVEDPARDVVFPAVVAHMPMHQFARVNGDDHQLTFEFVDHRWIRDHLASFPDALQHERRDDVIIVTAQPKAIQAFLLSIAQEPRAWYAGSLLQRSDDDPQ